MTVELDTFTRPIRETGLPEATLRSVPLNLIVSSLTNPRKSFNEAKLQELAEDIRETGVHTPVLLRPLPGARVEDTRLNRLPGDPLPQFELVYGERRFRASKIAGNTSILATVRDLSEDQVLEIQVTENLLRDDLLPLEEAEGFQQLMDHKKASAEDVGKMIKRSKRYVYASIQLLKLGSEAREALAEGKLDKSHALMVATVLEPKLQAKALAKALERDYEGRPVSVRALDDWITTNCRLKLQGSKFDLKDITLRPGAGPCGTCPKRTGADPDLFDGYTGPDMCLDPGCYHDKRQTHADRELVKAERAGRRVLRDDKAAALLKYEHGTELHGYERLDEYPSYLLGLSGSTLRRALGKHCPEPTVVVHPKTGAHIEVLRTDLVKQLIKEHQLTHTAKQQKKRVEKEQALPIEQRVEFRDGWRDRVVKHAWEALAPGASFSLFDLLLAHLTQELLSTSSLSIGRALGLPDEDLEDDEAVRAKLIATPIEEVPYVYARWLLCRYAYGYGAFDKEDMARQAPRHPLAEIFQHTFTDVAAIQAAVKREIESAERAEDMAADAQEASVPPRPAAQAREGGGEKKKGKGKKSTAAPAGEKPLTSSAYAAAQIAESLQALEGQGQGSSAAPQSDDAGPVLRQAPAPAAMPATVDVDGGSVSGSADAARSDEGQAVLRAPAATTLPFAVGQAVRFKDGIRKPNGNLRTVAGREGTVETVQDEAITVRIGLGKTDLAKGRPDELEAVGEAPSELDGIVINQRVRVRDEAVSQIYAGQLGRVVAVSANGHAWDVRLDPANKKKAQVATFAEGELEVIAA